MAKTIRLLATYQGYKRNDIITLDDATADKLLLGGVSATLDLTGGTQAFQQSPGSGLSSGSNLPLNQTITAGQTLDMTVPSGITLGLSATADIVGTWSVVNPDGTTSSPTPLAAGTGAVGVFVSDTKVRFNISFGTLQVKPTAAAGAVDGVPLYTSSATLETASDRRGFNKNVPAATVPVITARAPTTTAGVFLPVGDVNLTQTGAVGQAGDYLDRMVVQVEAGGNAAIYLSQRGDNVFVDTTAVGGAIANSSTQTFTTGPNLVATAGQLSGRVISFFYIPTGETVGRWFTTTLTGNNAPVTNTITVTLKDTPPAGAAPTRWIIHGPRAKRLMEPGRAARDEPYVVTVNESSVTGGFVLWLGSSIARADSYIIAN